MLMIRLATLNDVDALSMIHQSNFPRQMCSSTWLNASINAYPRFLVYVLLKNHEIIGYIIWAFKSGFRTQAIIELDQIAISPHQQKQGLGKYLIEQSLSLVQYQLHMQHQTLKAIWVNTAINNPAQRLYQNSLDVKAVATLTGLYTQDELIMIKVMEDKE